MDAKFAGLVDSLHPNLEGMLRQAPYKRGDLLPLEGIYLFTEAGRPLYVGRSRNIRRRYAHHTNPGSRTNQAVFAMLLAREKLGLVADYRPGPTTRANLMSDPGFIETFSKAKERIAQMEFRAVEEADPVRQALLEIYCSVVLETPYNDFRTH